MCSLGILVVLSYAIATEHFDLSVGSIMTLSDTRLSPVRLSEKTDRDQSQSQPLSQYDLTSGGTTSVSRPPV